MIGESISMGDDSQLSWRTSPPDSLIFSCSYAIILSTTKKKQDEKVLLGLGVICRQSAHLF